jgi:hypothetical protein
MASTQNVCKVSNEPRLLPRTRHRDLALHDCVIRFDTKIGFARKILALTNLKIAQNTAIALPHDTRYPGCDVNPRVSYVRCVHCNLVRLEIPSSDPQGFTEMNDHKLRFGYKK